MCGIYFHKTKIYNKCSKQYNEYVLNQQIKSKHLFLDEDTHAPLDLLKIMITSNTNIVDNININVQCVICMSNMRNNNEKIRITKCCHMFHAKCLDTYWCTSDDDKLKCPLCGYDRHMLNNNMKNLIDCEV
jgi:hypothetical protein